MAVLTVQASSPDTASSVTFTSASSGGDGFANTGRERLWLQNTNAGGTFIMVTLASHNVCNQGFMHNSVVRVNGGQTVQLGPFDTFRFNDSTGKVSITYSSVTNLHVAVTG